jgi:hypothetical protein
VKEAAKHVLTILTAQLDQPHPPLPQSDNTIRNQVLSQQQPTPPRQPRLKPTRTQTTLLTLQHQSTPGAKTRPSPTTVTRPRRACLLHRRLNLTFPIPIQARKTAVTQPVLHFLPTLFPTHQLCYLRITSPQHLQSHMSTCQVHLRMSHLKQGRIHCSTTPLLLHHLKTTPHGNNATTSDLQPFIPLQTCRRQQHNDLDIVLLEQLLQSLLTRPWYLKMIMLSPQSSPPYRL